MIYTVRGAIKKEELGRTLSHEHLYWGGFDVESMYFEKKYEEEKTAQVYHVLLPLFKKLHQTGCRTVVETSPPEGSQNLKLMEMLSRASGINILPNTGMAFSTHIYDIHKQADEMELAKRWIEDFEKGLDTINGVTIRPSQIKIFTNRGKLSEAYKKIIKAAVIASRKTGMPIHCHILEAGTAEEVIDLLERVDCNFNKFLWAHASADANKETMARALSKGMWLGFDDVKKDSLQKYCTLVKDAFEKGYQDRILLSQDYDFYEEMVNSPENHSCTDLFTDFIPYCEEMGLAPKVLEDILVKNPADFFDME